EQYETILSTAEQGASNFDLARNRANLGLEYFRAGHFADARANLERAVELYRESFSEPRAILALYGLGRVYLAQGQTPRAQEYADIAGGLARDTQDRWQAECLQLSAALHALRAEWDAAVQDSTQALEIHKRVGHVAAMVESL